MARSDELAALFEHPDGAHRHSEICRAYFLERRTAQAIADHFELHPGTVKAIVRDFAADPDLSLFFRTTRPGRKTAPKREAIRERVRALRGQHQTLGEIRGKLCEEGHEVSESYLATDEGAGLFAGLNVLPKITYSTDYSYRPQRAMNQRFVDNLMRHFPLESPPRSLPGRERRPRRLPR